jgi:hypothetical protein
LIELWNFLCEYGVASPDITNTSSSPVGETRFGILVRWHDYGKAVWADKKYIPGAAGVLGVQETASAIVIKAGSGRYVFELKGE